MLYPKLTIDYITKNIIATKSSHRIVVGDNVCGCCGSIYQTVDFPRGIAVSVDSTPIELKDYIPEGSTRYKVQPAVIPLAEDSFLNIKTTHVVDPDQLAGETWIWTRQDTKSSATWKQGERGSVDVSFIFYAGWAGMRNYKVQTGEYTKNQWGEEYPAYTNTRAELEEVVKTVEERMRDHFKGRYLAFILNTKDEQDKKAEKWFESMGWTDVVFKSALFNNLGYDDNADYLRFYLIKG